MKEFNIESAKKADKVITRCGFTAEFSITDDGQEKPYKFNIYDNFGHPVMSHNYASNGMFIADLYGGAKSDLDLFMAQASDFKPKDTKPGYYRGDLNTANEIIDDLVKRGGKNIYGYKGAYSNFIYFIDQFGNINKSPYNDVKDSLDRCTELHLPLKPKCKEGWAVVIKDVNTGVLSVMPTCGFYSNIYDAQGVTLSLEEGHIPIKIVKVSYEEYKVI